MAEPTRVATMTTWAEIAAKAQEATRPDNKLEIAVWRMAGKPDPAYYGHHTESVDAVLALIVAKLPGAMWSVCDMEDGPFAQIIRPMPDGGYVGGLSSSGASTPALALLAAFALAMQAEEGAQTETAS